MSRLTLGHGGNAMRTMAARLADEQRSYFRLLRYLLKDEIAAVYAEPPVQPMPQQFADLLAQLDNREPAPSKRR